VVGVPCTESGARIPRSSRAPDPKVRQPERTPPLPCGPDAALTHSCD
jgi:hypothetical protein